MDNKKETLTFLRTLGLIAFALIVCVASSAGCLNFAVTSGEHFYIVPAVLNLGAWGFVLYKFIKKLIAEGKLWN